MNFLPYDWHNNLRGKVNVMTQEADRLVSLRRQVQESETLLREYEQAARDYLATIHTAIDVARDLVNDPVAPPTPDGPRKIRLAAEEVDAQP